MEEFEIEFKELDQFEIEDTREVVIQEVPVFPDVVDLEVTPSKETQVFKEDGINYGEVKVLGDEDLQSSNIKQGVEIFGVTGSLEELTTETKEGIDNQEEIITNQETTLEEINQVIQDKILVKEKFKPRYLYYPISFQNYTGTELDHEVSTLDTSYFANMNYMFGKSSNLIRLDLSHWNTSNVTDMSYMFRDCKNLTELDLSSFDTSNVTTMQMMFYGCKVLKHLDIRNFTFDKVTNYSNMFYDVPDNCLIIVKSQTEKEWVLARRIYFTNVKTVAELEG